MCSEGLQQFLGRVVLTVFGEAVEFALIQTLQ